MFLLNFSIVVLALPSIWLQVARLKKARTSEGLSTTYVVFGTSSAATWLVYGFLAHQSLQIVVNGSTLVAQILLMALVIRYAPKYRKLAFVIAGYSTLMVVGGLLLGPVLVGALGSTLAATSRMPQMYTSWRYPGVSAVSVSSFGLTAAVSFLWAIFGVIHGDPFIVSCSALAVGTCIFIIARTRVPVALDESYSEEAVYATA